MARIDTLVAVAHRRLRLRRLLVAIERHPELLEKDLMAPLTIKKPTELAGLKSRLTRADAQEKSIAKLGERYDTVLNGIDELVAAHVTHVGDLETYEKDLRSRIESMVGSNGDPSQAGQDGQPSDQSGQVINGVKVS